MLELVTRSMLERYLESDTISARLDACTHDGDEELTCQRWLRQTPPKRLIYERLYGDLLRGGAPRRVLDVGGGLSALTRELARHHDYTLVELLAHDPPERAERMMAEVGKRFLVRKEWYEYVPDGPYDIVIANDLFPNVDQRLELFLGRYVEGASLIRLSLTYYNDPRFYLARRVDADEILCMMAWNGRMTGSALQPFLGPEHRRRLTSFEQDNPSVYDNGRQVCLVEIAGRSPRS